MENGMKFLMDLQFDNIPFVISFIVASILIFLASLYWCWKIKNRYVIISFSILDVIIIASLALSPNFDILLLIALAVYIVFSILCGVMNAGILRNYLSVKMKKKESKRSGEYDKEALIKNVVEAVDWLSNQKVGALITFERENALDDYMINGTRINCPFTPEIVETIFYEGTRLHDGAIIVKDNIIIAAAVYYRPSTAVIKGKFGARHRAAVGISEDTDSITILVSEETGRISIAHNGILDTVKKDEFEAVFRKRIM